MVHAHLGGYLTPREEEKGEKKYKQDGIYDG